MPAHCSSAISLFLLVCLLPSFSWARETITWMEANIPPFFIHQQNHKQGYGNEISAIIQAQLPQYKHTTLATNITRHFYKFKQGENVCSVGLFPTEERKKYVYFSIPSFLSLPSVLIVKKKRLALFHHQHNVSLKNILLNKNIVIGVIKDRSYGATLDALITQYSDENNIIQSPGKELTNPLFKMLLLDRVDAVLSLPDEFLYQAEQMGIRTQLTTLTVQENQQNFNDWMSAVACSKTPWGKKVIRQVNTILRKERPTLQYRSAYERWLDPNSISTYRHVYDEVFLKQKK